MAPTAPERYRVQFTIDEGTRRRLRRLQDWLRREIPDGDPAEIFSQALAVLEEQVEKKRLGSGRTRRRRTRSATDEDMRKRTKRSRQVPLSVKRPVWIRDEGRCVYVSAAGHRCSETSFLEFHHIQPWALKGPPTVDNIALRCRQHNQYEAELIFGPRSTDQRRCQVQAQAQQLRAGLRSATDSSCMPRTSVQSS